jgi:predicted SAM-dependent methyltransferase
MFETLRAYKTRSERATERRQVTTGVAAPLTVDGTVSVGRTLVNRGHKVLTPHTFPKRHDRHSSVPSQTQLMRLNLGCGPGPQPDGWIHLDGSWNAWFGKAPRVRRMLGALGLVPMAAQHDWRPDVVVANLRRELPFPPSTFDCVYASHVLEHLYEDEVVALLRDCVRVLRPRGVLRLVVPDVKAIVREYVDRKSGRGQSGDTLPADWLNERLHFQQRSRPRGFAVHRFYAALTQLHFHKWMYDAETLTNRMVRAGLSDTQERGLWDSRILGIEAIENPERLEDGAGVCLEAVKA